MKNALILGAALIINAGTAQGQRDNDTTKRVALTVGLAGITYATYHFLAKPLKKPSCNSAYGNCKEEYNGFKSVYLDSIKLMPPNYDGGVQFNNNTKNGERRLVLWGAREFVNEKIPSKETHDTYYSKPEGHQKVVKALSIRDNELKKAVRKWQALQAASVTVFTAGATAIWWKKITNTLS